MLTPNFTPFPVLETPRLLLREPKLTDAADLFVLRSDPEVMRYIPRPLAKDLKDVEDLIQLINGFTQNNERINWAIELKETGTVVGMLGYVNIDPPHDRAEIGYSLAKAWHRKGITREAILPIMQYGFEQMKLHSISAQLDEDNIPSAKLLESVGFRHEARFVEDFFYNGAYRTSLHYGMLRREYESKA